MQAPSKKENKFQVCFPGSCLWALCKREEEILRRDFTPMTIQLEKSDKGMGVGFTGMRRG